MKRMLIIYLLALGCLSTQSQAYTVPQYFDAIHYGNIDLVKKCVDSGINPSQKLNQNDNGLMIACNYGHPKLVEYLISCKVDLNAQTITAKTTAIMIAASRGHMDIVKMLVEAGADITIVNHTQSTAEDLARYWDHAEIADYLAKVKSDKK